MNVYLVYVCAASIVLNILLITYCLRISHWMDYWRDRYNDSIAPIDPVFSDPYKSVKESIGYDMEEEWDNL